MLNKFISDTSNNIIVCGSCSRSCLEISDPIDPPAPDTKKCFDDVSEITPFTTLALGNKSSNERF